MTRTKSGVIDDASFDAMDGEDLGGETLGGEALLSEALLSEAAAPPLSEAATRYEAAKPNVVDDNQGQGGSYILDSETGVRTLIQRTLPSTPNEVSLNGPSDSQASDLGEDRDDLRN